MGNTITDTNFNFPGQKSVYKGKVREVYRLENDILVIVATDRLSAFDVVMPKGIPFKGQILNQIATKMMTATADIVPNWLLDTPDPNVAVGHACRPYRGHVYTPYKKTKALHFGPLPDTGYNYLNKHIPKELAHFIYYKIGKVVSILPMPTKARWDICKTPPVDYSDQLDLLLK